MRAWRHQLTGKVTFMYLVNFGVILYSYTRAGKANTNLYDTRIWSVTSEHMSPHFTEEQWGNQRGRGQRSTRTKYQLKHTKHTHTR